MAQRKYVSLSKLSTFLDNLKDKFAVINHKHKLGDIEDYTVDSVLSSTSTNPVQNKILNDEFDAISEALNVYDTILDDKADITHIHSIDDVTNLQETLDTIESQMPEKIPLASGISENSLAMTGNTAGAKGYYFASFSISSDGTLVDIQISKDGALSNSTGTISPATLGWEVGDRVSIVNGNMFDNVGTIASISDASLQIALNVNISNSYNDVVHNDQDKSIVNIDKPNLGIVDFGLNTVALGKDNKALLSYSFVQGWNNEGIGKYCTIFGRENMAGFAGYVAGWNNKSTGEYCDVFGQNNTVNGNGASVHGRGHNVDGEAAAVFGINNAVSGRAAAALGIGLRANISPQAVVGKYNKENSSAYFIVGTGTGSATDKRSNTLEVAPSKVDITGSLNVANGAKIGTNITNGTAIATGDSAVSFGKSANTDYSANGECAFSAGINNMAIDRASATFGIRSQTGRDCQLVCGRDNAVDSNALFIVGKGTGSANKMNAFTVSPTSITARVDNMFDLGDVGEDNVAYTLTLDKVGLTVKAPIQSSYGITLSGYGDCLNIPKGYIRLGEAELTEARLKKLVSFLDTISD